MHTRVHVNMHTLWAIHRPLSILMTGDKGRLCDNVFDPSRKDVSSSFSAEVVKRNPHFLLQKNK